MTSVYRKKTIQERERLLDGPGAPTVLSGPQTGTRLMRTLKGGGYRSGGDRERRRGEYLIPSSSVNNHQGQRR